jgi:hypothetical protein
MVSQKVNKYSKKLRKEGHYLHRFAQDGIKPLLDIQTGFILHPTSFPIDIKRLWFTGWGPDETGDPGNIGVIFESEKYFRPGSMLEISIPLRKDHEKFRGKVVLVKNFGNRFDIGLWFCCRADASRARIVEQICHIETYIQGKKYRDGPYCLNRDKMAEEWIINNASQVPTL